MREESIQLRACLLACCASLLSLWSSASQARLVEEIIKVPVKVVNAYGKVSEQDAVVTLLRDDSLTGPLPIALINHGRAAYPDQRAKFGRAISSSNARWFASLGFFVVLPTRVGYGVTGGDDVEDSGDCSRKNYPPGYEAAAAQSLQILAAVRQRPGVLPDRTLVLGQSFGGATAIAVAAKNPPGVQLAINFAGGGGGNPETQPQQPCGVPQLKRLFASYGRTARIPTLWVYTENDQWMGPKYPREWFDAYKAEGGTGEFVLFPPNGKDGHPLFSQDPGVWRPTVLEFLRANGYPDVRAGGEEKASTPAQR